MEAFASSTQKTRASQWRNYELFCASYNLEPLPVFPENVCRFLVLKSRTVCYTTLTNYVSAINLLVKMDGEKLDLRDDFKVSLTLRGLRRILGDSTNPKDPLLSRDLMAIRELVNFDDFQEHGTWIGVLFAFRSLLRKCHFFPETDDRWTLLSRGEIFWHDWGLSIKIRRSKTIQFSQRHYESLISYCDGPLCIVTALKNFWSKYPTPPVEPIICDQKGQCVPYRIAIELLQKWGKVVCPNKNMGLHSLRRGMATEMKNAGVDLLDIQHTGDWQSLCVLRYLSSSLERRLYIDKRVSSTFP